MRHCQILVPWNLLLKAHGCNIYPRDIDTFAQLRWHLFAKFRSDADKLPPTMAPLTQA